MSAIALTTPGPWHATKDSQANRWEVWSTTTRERICRCKQSTTAASNARLIVASLDLRAVAVELDRLSLVIESCVRLTSPSHAAEVLAMVLANRAALVKAGGQ